MTVLHRRKDASPRSSATSEQFPTSRHGSFGYPPKLDGLRMLSTSTSRIFQYRWLVDVCCANSSKIYSPQLCVEKASNLTNEARKLLKALEVHSHRG